jgi:integrase
MNQPYSEPKIFTGGVDINQWKGLSSIEKKLALSKEWFVYYSFRDPKSRKLKRQSHIKAGANRHKSMRVRLKVLKTLQRNLFLLLENGFNPYEDNTTNKERFLGKQEKTIDQTEIVSIKPATTSNKEQQVEIDKIEVINEISISEAFKFGLEIKKRELNSNSFNGYSSHINRFEKWLTEKELSDKGISAITKPLLMEYFNSILQVSSARNRNNYRASISSLFTTLEDNELIKDNFVKKIKNLKTTPERNKTYTPTMQKDIYEYMRENDSILLLFVQFISYNLLRPIEVCRLKIEDIDVNDKKLYVKAKNKAVKIKIIPDYLLKEIPDLSKMDKKLLLFTPEKIGGEWQANETNRRDHFSKRFKEVKDHFGLDINYGMYSFRHTFITKLYQELRKDYTQFEAKSRLMLITGHATMLALEQYLRDIDAELPEDYSDLLNSE